MRGRTRNLLFFGETVATAASIGAQTIGLQYVHGYHNAVYCSTSSAPASSPEPTPPTKETTNKPRF